MLFRGSPMKDSNQINIIKSRRFVVSSLPGPYGEDEKLATLTNQFQSDSDDVLDFLDEADEDQDGLSKQNMPWKILVTDDDKNVHDTTLLALHGVKLHGRPLEFMHAYSAGQARQMLSDHPDTDLILLDVVMETVDAGLNLVDIIRNDMQLANLRIVLRTGQPGYAPEPDVTHRYGINGYTTKSKLTRNLLISVMSDALDHGASDGLAN